MDIYEEATINDIVVTLQEMGEYHDDIFMLSYQANGCTYSYKILNKGDGKEGVELNNFSNLKHIYFTDTVNQVDTNLLNYMESHKYNSINGDGEMVIAYDGKTRTTIMIAIHSSKLGPALGGLREKDYSNFDSMITDALRLAKGMTYKAAIADTGTGGGKSTRTVPLGIRRQANLATARVVNFINEMRNKRSVNSYYLAEDSNTTSNDFDDMDDICLNTTCKSLHYGGTGNPSPITAIGVYHAAKVAAEFAFPDNKLDNKVILLSGVGQVGYELLKNFISNGVKQVICAEMNKERIEWVKKQFERMGEINKIRFILYSKEQLINQKFLHDLANEIDVFAPCALGRSINDTNINVLKDTRLRLICGAENNQLANEDRHGKMLHDMGILYVPDYVANSGGLINCSQEMRGRMFLINETIEKARKVEDTVRAILAKSKKENIPAYLAANKLAEEKFC